MANYYTQFSFIIPLTPEQTQEALIQINDPNINCLIFEDPEFVTLRIEADEEGLWVASEEDCSTNDAIDLLEHLVGYFELPPMGFEWSHSCSKPRVDGFGGGAVWTDGESTDYLTTGEWLSSKNYDYLATQEWIRTHEPEIC